MIMGGVVNVDQEEDDETNWKGKVGFTKREWKAKILEQIPDERIVWETKGGADHRGTVNFHHLDDNLTRVHVEMEYFPKGVIEKTGNVFLAARRRVRKDLRLFKHFIELRNEETGAWRGEISQDAEEAEGEAQDEAAATEEAEPEAAEEAEPEATEEAEPEATEEAAEAGAEEPDEQAEEPSTNGETPPSKGLRRRVAKARTGGDQDSDE
jgi:hypothetical protein